MKELTDTRIRTDVSTKSVSVETEDLSRGRESVRRFRNRLKATYDTNKETVVSAEPKATRELVEKLRARLVALTKERDELEHAFDVATQDLENVRAELDIKKQALAKSEATAYERAQFANELMAEMETLAGERDQAMMHIAELKLRDEQQRVLLNEAEKAEGKKDEQIKNLRIHQEELIQELEQRAEKEQKLQTQLAKQSAEHDELLQCVRTMENQLRTFHDS